MKPIVCPISSHRIEEHIPRVTASLVVSLLVIFITTGFWPIIAILVFDFYTRGFNNGQYSILSKTAKAISSFAKIKSNKTDKAPKIFAARLGLVFTLLILILHISNLTSIAIAGSVLLIIFASMECIFNFCIGCYVYTFFILNLYGSKQF